MDSGVAEKSWLYLNGNAVICTRHMEVATIVSGMNPAINSSMDSVELGALQQVSSQGKYCCQEVPVCSAYQASRHEDVVVN